MKEWILGEEHRDTLTSVCWLAYLLHHQNKYEDVLPFSELISTTIRSNLV